MGVGTCTGAGAGIETVSVVPRDCWATAAPHPFGFEAAREAQERGAEGVAGCGATGGAATWTGGGAGVAAGAAGIGAC